MKKPSKKLERWRQRRDKRIKQRQIKNAVKELCHKDERIEFRLRNADYLKVLAKRRSLTKRIYEVRDYKGAPSEVRIEGPIGIEDPKGLSRFLDTASDIIDFGGGGLRLDLDDCSRVWPSAVMLFCSLRQWVTLTMQQGSRVSISSSRPSEPKVAGYLTQCGFYDYVGRRSDPVSSGFDYRSMVRIESERNRKRINARAQELEQFVQEHCSLDEESRERFNCYVLAEVFNNITEHGRASHYQGWWLMAQVHLRHGFASICLADNGIGFGNTLRSGWQASTFSSAKRAKMEKDGYCIEMALEPDISGSIKAPPRKGRIFPQHERGARKGNGLKRMRDCCKDLGIRLSILSHQGYIVIGDNGRIAERGSRDSRIFAGTMYHLLIRT